VGQIVSILSKDFIRLVIVASLIAVPISWWAMNKWLDDFAYKTTLNWWVFVLSTLFMIAIALITLSIQTIRAAWANPVESLRSD
jgi:putative ABC transport system permease protein